MLAYESYGLLLYTLTYIYIYTWVIYSNERWNLLSSTFGIWGHDSGKAARDAASSELVGLATSPTPGERRGVGEGPEDLGPWAPVGCSFLMAGDDETRDRGFNRS